MVELSLRKMRNSRCSFNRFVILRRDQLCEAIGHGVDVVDAVLQTVVLILKVFAS